MSISINKTDIKSLTSLEKVLGKSVSKDSLVYFSSSKGNGSVLFIVSSPKNNINIRFEVQASVETDVSGQTEFLDIVDIINSFEDEDVVISKDDKGLLFINDFPIENLGDFRDINVLIQAGEFELTNKQAKAMLRKLKGVAKQLKKSIFVESTYCLCSVNKNRIDFNSISDTDKIEDSFEDEFTHTAPFEFYLDKKIISLLGKLVKSNPITMTSFGDYNVLLEIGEYQLIIKEINLNYKIFRPIYKEKVK